MRKYSSKLTGGQDLNFSTGNPRAEVTSDQPSIVLHVANNKVKH